MATGGTSFPSVEIPEREDDRVLREVLRDPPATLNVAGVCKMLPGHRANKARAPAAVTRWIAKGD